MSVAFFSPKYQNVLWSLKSIKVLIEPSLGLKSTAQLTCQSTQTHTHRHKANLTRYSSFQLSNSFFFLFTPTCHSRFQLHFLQPKTKQRKKEKKRREGKKKPNPFTPFKRCMYSQIHPPEHLIQPGKRHTQAVSKKSKQLDKLTSVKVTNWQARSEKEARSWTQFQSLWQLCLCVI